MRSLRSVAVDLAGAHRQADPTTSLIKFFPLTSKKEVRLLEVSSAAPTTGEILPFGFGAHDAVGVEYPSVVILVSPAEWDAIRAGTLHLPDGWDLSSAEEL